MVSLLLVPVSSKYIVRGILHDVLEFTAIG